MLSFFVFAEMHPAEKIEIYEVWYCLGFSNVGWAFSPPTKERGILEGGASPTLR